MFAAALLVFLVSLLALSSILFSYWQGRSVYEEIAKVAFVTPEDSSAVGLDDLSVDWDALQAVNPDVVAWVYMPGTNINYPVTHCGDNKYYLTHDFQGSEGLLATFGTIFLEASNSSDFSDVNNVMYGHNMNDGSMFSDVASLVDQQAFDANRVIYLLTPQGNYRLTTFSLVHCDANDPLVQTGFSTPGERASYLQDKIDRSVCVASDVVPVAEMTKTFAFSTCDNMPSNGRYVLFSYVAESTVPGVSAPGVSVGPDSARKADVAGESEVIGRASEGITERQSS